MTRCYRTLATLFAAAACAATFAQANGSNSSYSRFGLGTLNDQSQGFNKSMAGVGIGLRSGNRVNMANPASYASIDSITFIFDAGMNASFGSLHSGGTRVNVNNCNIDYVNAGLRLRKGVGISFGFVPYTSVGYSFSTSSIVGKESVSTQLISKTDTYSGSGGLHQAYIGLGTYVLKDLSLGFNAGLIWGSYNHTVAETFSEGSTQSSSYSGLTSTHEADIKTFKIDLGAQYPVRLTNVDHLTIGATASIGHKIKGEASMERYTTADSDPTPITAKNAFDLPYCYGVGLGWQHKNTLQAGVDFKHELWGDCRTPEYDKNTGEYTPTKGSYKDRMKVAAGAQYTIDPLNKRYAKRIQYRMGAHFSTPYLKINGADGPMEYGITAGVGLPITNNYTNRSMANVGVQWLRRAPSTTNMITENYLILNIGLTYNDAWFQKFKIK